MTNGKKLAEPVRPADTNNTVAYEVLGKNYMATTTLINVSNNLAEIVTFRVFLISDGQIASVGKDLFYDTELTPNTTYGIERPFELDKIGDQLIVQTGTANALTFFIFGVLHDAR